MRDLLIDLLLGVAIVSAWIGAIGFMRLSSALDRLHVTSFVTVASGLPIVLAAFVGDGPSTRAFKILILWGIAIVAGAAVNQAVARALFIRAEAGERM